MQKSVTNIKTLSELEPFVADFYQNLQPKQNGATVITLSGDLGAGKTTFSQYLGRCLGIMGPISSPTFVISKTYPLSESGSDGFRQMVHIDAYRLESERDLDLIGFTGEAKDSSNLILVEWPSKVSVTGDIAISISYDHQSEERVFIIEKNL